VVRALPYEEPGDDTTMNTTAGWSMKLALVLVVAALVWAGAASIAVSALEGRARTPAVLAAR
jgi:hypothetical protein